MSPSRLRDIGFALMLASLLNAGRVEAAPPCSSCWPMPHWLGVACGCCPDDYCQKPLPPLQCNPPQCCPDNYCKKPLPGIPCTHCEHSCDCYNVKPLPAVPRCCEPWYKCIPFCGSK